MSDNYYEFKKVNDENEISIKFKDSKELRVSLEAFLGAIGWTEYDIIKFFKDEDED